MTATAPAALAPVAALIAPPAADAQEQIARNLRKATDAIKAVWLDVQKSAAHYRVCGRIANTDIVLVERIGSGKSPYQVNMRTQTCTCDCARTHTVRYNGYLVAAGSPEKYRCKHYVLAAESIKAAKAEGFDLFNDAPTVPPVVAVPRTPISREQMERDFA